MRIGVDLDGVLSQTIPAIIEFHNHTYGTNFVLEKFNSHDYWEVWGGTRDEAIDKVYEFYKTDYFRNIKPVPGALEVLNIFKKNNNLVIITARADIIADTTRKWVEKYFPNIFSEIYFANHFAQEGTERTKQEFCDSLDIDILIEDVIKYAAECVAPKRRVLLLDYPWNKVASLPVGIERVYSWKEILEKIEK